MKARGINSILGSIVIFQIMFLVILVSNLLYPEIPQITFLRQFVGFLYLTFVPGTLLLVLLLGTSISKLRFGEFVVYVIGLSFSFLMFLGFLINVLIINIDVGMGFLLKPFSVLVLNIAIQISVSILLFFNYIKKCKYPHYDLFKLNLLPKSSVMFLFFPLLSVISIYLVNYCNSNILALLLILAVSVVLVGVTFNSIRRENYPAVIWAIGLSLLFLNSLIGRYPKATDNMLEINLLNFIITRGFWDYTTPVNVNSMLGVVVLVPIYSVVCSVNLICIYKYIIPLFSSIIPVGLYEAFRKISDDRISFFSCFFFMSMYEYYTWFGLTMKMVTAGLFLTLLILVIVSDELNMFYRLTLLLLFAFSLSVSHYGTSYIFMFCLVSVFILTRIYKKTVKEAIVVFSFIFVVSYIVFTLSWYIYSSSSHPYLNLICLLRQIVESILSKSVVPRHSYTYKILGENLPLYLQILKFLYILSAFFIAVGLLSSIIEFRRNKFSYEFIIFSVCIFISGCSIFLGRLSGIATPDRIYQILSFFLAPFCIIGGVKIANYFLRFLRVRCCDGGIKFITVFLVLFLLSNTCLINEVIWKYNIGPDISISVPRILTSGTVQEREYFSRVYMLPVDVKSAEWLRQHIADDSRVYCGKDMGKVFVVARVICSSSGRLHVYNILDNNVICRRSYIYLGSFNVLSKKIKIGGSIVPEFINLENISEINTGIKIYINSNSQIYYY